ncbi:hypothetical protein CcaCcLH18_11248 [Colletotrichum camelliae]|nr:hypothetical protein CcaCcLH18_11248 [Colletotrichum camelliae]
MDCVRDLHKVQAERVKMSYDELICVTNKRLEPSLWLARVGWAVHLKGLSARALFNTTSPINKDEVVLQAMWATVERMLDRAQATSAPNTIRLAVLFEAQRTEAHVKLRRPFNNRMEDNTWVSAGDGWLFMRLAWSPADVERWGLSSSVGNGCRTTDQAFQLSAVQEFGRTFKRLRKQLWMLLHMLSGQLARASELAGLRTVNTVNGGVCNILVHNKMLCFAASIIFITPKLVVTKGFRDFIARLEGRQALDCVVMDECYVVLEGLRSFWLQLRELGEVIRKFSVQIVCLTATLALTDEAVFFHAMQLEASWVRIFQMATTRKNI